MGKSVKLGLLAPLSGIVGLYGDEISTAAKIACDEVNEEGGVLGLPLEIIIEDDGSMPDTAIDAAERLVNKHKCQALIGNLLSNSRIAVAYRVAEPLRIPLLNFSFYEGGIMSHYFFHFGALPNQQIDMMIPFMANKYGKKIFFAGHEYQWPRGSIDAGKKSLRNINGQIVGEQYLPIGTSKADLEELLNNLEKSDADVFIPYFAGQDQIELLTLFSQRGLQDKIAVVMGHYDENMASKLPPNVRSGLYSTNTYFMSIPTTENKMYQERLEKENGINGVWPKGNGILTNFGEGTYICVKAYAKAINCAKSLDTEDIIQALKVVEVKSPQGLVSMNPTNHHATVNSFLTQCQSDGKW